MTEPTILKIAIALFALLLLSGWVTGAMPLSPWIRVVRRWVRFAFFSLAIGLAAKKYIFVNESLPALTAAGALLYILTETLIYWLQICAASVSGLSPFGRYKPTESAWSCDPNMISLKRKIEEAGFRKVGAFNLEYGYELSAKTTVFDSEDSTIRLDVTFIPFANSYIVSSSVCSIDSDSTRYLTDGNPTPFGLPFPKKWHVERRPLACNPLKLLKIHMKMMTASGKEFVKFTDTAQEYVVQTLSQIEKQSVRDGLINTGIEAEDSGLFSQDGKMLIWLDMIKTNYFPFFR